MGELVWFIPNHRAPDGWIERQAQYAGWLIKVWYSSSGCFMSRLICTDTNDGLRFELNSNDLDSACREAGQMFLQLIGKVDIHGQ